MDAVTGTVGTRHDAAGALAVPAAGGLLLYAEPSGERAHLTAVDVRTGVVKWDVGLPGLGSYQPLTAATAGDKVYVVWRGLDGRLRLFGARTTDGGATEDRTIACTTRCPVVALAAKPTHAVVMTRGGEGHRAVPERRLTPSPVRHLRQQPIGHRRATQTSSRRRRLTADRTPSDPAASAGPAVPGRS